MISQSIDKPRKTFRRHLFEKRTPLQRAVFIFVSVIFILYAVTLIYPFLITFLNTMKTSAEYWEDPVGMPARLTLKNFALAFSEFNVGEYSYLEMLGNSLVLSVLSSFLAVASSCMSAYIFSKYKFRSSETLYGVAIILMMLPSIGTLPALYKLMIDLHLKNSVIGVSLTAAGGFGSYFLFMYATFATISWSYAEAAFVDGAGNFYTFFRIMLPQARGTLLSLLLLSFIATWNDYMTPYLYLDRNPTIALGLHQFEISIRQGSANYPLFFSGVLISMLPVVVLFLIFQDTLMNNVSVGGLKG
ncbi:MAG: hypothetical protein DBX59_02325 [Bacillota bacterium]|nr:MAG: hypothetical protein DBX59_02325 [Bacillota bacterium]